VSEQEIVAALTDEELILTFEYMEERVEILRQEYVKRGIEK
jgi:hypothetical protein